MNGDGVIDSYDKVVGVGHPNVPEIVYGFGLNIEYKGFYSFSVGVKTERKILLSCLVL